MTRDMMAYEIAERDAMGTPSDEEVTAALEALPETAVYVDVPMEQIEAYRKLDGEYLSDYRGILFTSTDGFIAEDQESADAVVDRITV